MNSFNSERAFSNFLVSGQYMSYWEIESGVHIVCFDRMAVSSIFNYLLNPLYPFTHHI